MNTARRANEAMMSGKKLSDYDLPDSVKSKISNRHYSQDEINLKYAQYLKSKTKSK